MKIFFPVFVVLLAACTNSADGTGEKADSSHTTQPATGPGTNLTGCYRHIVQRDTIHLQLKQSADSVSGTIHFDNYQKDSSSGIVKGSIRNDTIFLWYSFFSEGMHSVMEIVLKKTADELVRATGPMETRGDTALFKDHGMLRFDPQQSFLPIGCGN
jgi:hypothetical protein